MTTISYQEFYEDVCRLIFKRSVEYQEANHYDFRKTLQWCLHEYLRYTGKAFPQISYIEQIVDVCTYMNVIVKCQFQGKHSTAYAKLKNVLKRFDVELFTTIHEGEFFYRMRVCDLRKNFGRKDLFHIPLNKVRSIKTQRYSAPGYPCLYLAKSLYGCWEEMHRPDTETTLFSAFTPTQSLRVMDLRIPDFEQFSRERDKYIRLFPIIIASTLPVVNDQDVFKPEYIISQLLLELIIDLKTECNAFGIYYTSAFKNEDFYVLDHEWDNLAIPVQRPLSKTELCPVLTSLFKSTKPTCFEYESFQGNINALGFRDGDSKRMAFGDPDKAKYYRSQFSRLEELIENREFKFVNE